VCVFAYRPLIIDRPTVNAVVETAIRPRYDHSTTFVMTIDLHAAAQRPK